MKSQGIDQSKFGRPKFGKPLTESWHALNQIKKGLTERCPDRRPKFVVAPMEYQQKQDRSIEVR